MAVAVRNECLMFGVIVQLVAPDLSRYSHGVAGKLGVALLGVVSESEEGCQHLRQHTTPGGGTCADEITASHTPAYTTHLSAGKRYYKKVSFGANVSFVFNERIRTACLITG